jgi:hypothetical protein
MATRLTYLALAFGTVGLSALAYAEGTDTGVLKLPQDIEFKGPLTGPPQTVGDGISRHPRRCPCH